MSTLYLQAFDLLKTGEPIVVAGLFCALIAVGFLLGKGASHGKKLIHRRWNHKATDKELLS